MIKKTAILCITLCLSATCVLAQTKKETPQEKILRLEIENAQLKRQNTQLQNQITQLKKVQAQLPTKPYYRTKQIETICQKYPVCKKWAEKQYKLDQFFEITSIQALRVKENSYPPFYQNPYKTSITLSISCRTQFQHNLFTGLTVAYDDHPIQ